MTVGKREGVALRAHQLMYMANGIQTRGTSHQGVHVKASRTSDLKRRRGWWTGKCTQSV